MQGWWLAICVVEIQGRGRKFNDGGDWREEVVGACQIEVGGWIVKAWRRTVVKGKRLGGEEYLLVSVGRKIIRYYN